MKNIQIYNADKYLTSAYEKVEENIYKGRNPYYRGSSWESEEMYVTSLTFEQEPSLGEGETPDDISQYPLEDILERFGKERVNKSLVQSIWRTSGNFWG